MRLPVILALKELRYDWQAAACFVAALVGVLAPLLIILALKNGAIDAMLSRLVEDPSNKELIAVGASTHNGQFFEEIGGREDVLFVTPATRNINAQANIVRNLDARKLARRVVLIPSAPGDPISTTADVSVGRVVLSERLAKELEVSAGDTLEMSIDRRINNSVETATRSLEVAGIAPPENYSRSAMFIGLQDLVAIERFRDDINVSADDWDVPRSMPETFASFRLYARSLKDIEGLESDLESRGVRTRPRADNVNVLLLFQRNLSLLFIVISALAVAGFWAAMAANLRGAVERQRISLSLLHLLGLSTRERCLIPIVQSVILVLGGVCTTLLFVIPALILINEFFTPDGFERIAWLGPKHIIGTAIVGLITATTSSLWAVLAIGEIKSDEVLRNT